jgi:hypothetical protein
VVVGGSVVVVVVVSGTVVVVVGSVGGGSDPAPARSPNRINGATTTIVANTARAADEYGRGVDIGRSRRAPRPVAHRTTSYRPSCARG